MKRWLDVPIGRHSGRRDLTWGMFAARFDRCFGRIAFYVGQRVHDRETFERIVTEVLERNGDLLLVEHNELEELRRLRSTADRLMATSVAGRPGCGSRPSRGSDPRA
jgi:hypothetical protein